MKSNHEVQPAFAGLAEDSPASRYGRLAAGIAANCLVVLSLVFFGIGQSHRTQNGRPTRWVAITFAPTTQAQSKFKPLPTTPTPVRKIWKAESRTQIPHPPLELPKPPEISAANLPALPKSVSIAIPRPPPPKPIVGAFSSMIAEAAIPARKLHQAPVSTDFSATPVESKHSAPQAVSIGAFGSNLESGENQRPANRSIETGFFSSGVLAQAKPQTNAPAMLASAFEIEKPTSRARQGNSLSQTERVFKPVEILSKPRPQYTEQARRLGIEGEVAIQVLFEKDGKIKVFSVIQGLGYGLDENAMLAAAQIKFHPASRDGQPVDQRATIRVQFQLAQ